MLRREMWIPGCVEINISESCMKLSQAARKPANGGDRGLPMESYKVIKI